MPLAPILAHDLKVFATNFDYALSLRSKVAAAYPIHAVWLRSPGIKVWHIVGRYLGLPFLPGAIDLLLELALDVFAVTISN